MHSKHWQKVAVNSETSDSSTYISTNNDGCRTFAIVETNARVHSRYEKAVKIVIKDKNCSVLSSPEGCIEVMQDFEEKNRTTGS